jgi:hypothetical protein
MMEKRHISKAGYDKRNPGRPDSQPQYTIRRAAGSARKPEILLDIAGFCQCGRWAGFTLGQRYGFGVRGLPGFGAT